MPALVMEAADHALTLSFGGRTRAIRYRQIQAYFMSRGEFATAMSMDISDIRRIGSINHNNPLYYSTGMQQAINYAYLRDLITWHERSQLLRRARR